MCRMPNVASLFNKEKKSDLSNPRPILKENSCKMWFPMLRLSEHKNPPLVFIFNFQLNLTCFLLSFF